MNCPCELPASGEDTYQCDRLDCQLTPHYCELYQTRDNYRQARDAGTMWGQVNHENGIPTNATQRKQSGAGTELTKILRSLGIAKKAGCGCSGVAGKMNQRGPQWCRDNIDDILNHLAAEAQKRKLPFSAWVAKRLVILAIRRAERKLEV